MTDHKLICFDLDGTLIKNHLMDAECRACHGTGEGELPTPLMGGPEDDLIPDPCGTCGATGRVLVPTPEGYGHVEVLDGVALKLCDLQIAGTHIAICTNQGGVAFGFQTEEEVWDKCDVAYTRLAMNIGASRVSWHIAFHHPQGQGEYGVGENTAEHRLLGGYRRKPSGAMIREAGRMHHVGLDRVLMVGDLRSDLEAADEAGVDFAWAHTYFGRPE